MNRESSGEGSKRSRRQSAAKTRKRREALEAGKAVPYYAKEIVKRLLNLRRKR